MQRPTHPDPALGDPRLVRGRPTTGLGVPLRPVLRSRLTGAAESDSCRKTQPPELSVVAEPDLGRETRFLRAYGAAEADLCRKTQPPRPYGAAKADLCRRTMRSVELPATEADLCRETWLLGAYGAAKADLGRRT